ncbi:hypothetical protein [Breznakiella homolactica]|uniref:Uncharacterized protein n=1 Tax=Breznakiella homolactica TaxID=2798577 RepID=A0A7T7XJN5_9SPIR|nr:hypothetical protein [Breznakiella homolactica]QQO07606.1 hypothetical protein JFL75_11680 [Breznakiella homolactica]
MDEKIIRIIYSGLEEKILVDNDIPDNYIKSVIKNVDSHFRSLITTDIDTIEWIYCLVGNIIDQHEFGPDKEIKHGSKHFVPGAKVYCFPYHWDPGHGRIVVIGKPRKKYSYIKVVISVNFVHNFRLKKVYDKEIIREMYYGLGWDNTEHSKEKIIEWSDYFNNNPKMKACNLSDEKPD